MKFFKSSMSFFLILFVAVSTAVSQVGQQSMPKPANPDSVSDQEMQRVAKVTDSIQTIQRQVQSEIQTLVEDEGMKFSRFQKIMMSRQNPKASGNVKTTEKEKKTIQKIQPKVMKISQKAQQQFVQAIQSEGFSPQRFQRIMRAVQSNPEMRKRFKEASSSES